MAITSKTLKLIKHYEGLHDGDLSKAGLQPKLCPAGIWTVGWGHALVDPSTRKFLRGQADKARAYQLYPNLTQAEADFLLEKDLAVVEKDVRRVLPANLTLSDDQVGALLSFTYNLGIGNFLASSAYKALKAGNISSAGDKLLLWNKATVNGQKVVLQGLVKRRESERELLVKGELMIR